MLPLEYQLTTSTQQQVQAQPVASPTIMSSHQTSPGTTVVSVGVIGPTAAPGQVTALPYVFTTGTLHNPATDAWNMDTRASSHLNSSVTSLNDIFNTCMYPSISVGDGHSIPVTNIGHSILPTPTKPLHLNNDFMTRRVLLRCDSTEDLYPVTTPSSIPQALHVSQHMWHQRLGHPRSEVLRRLVSNNSISYNKEKPPVLCHACQLGKHVRLPFPSPADSPLVAHDATVPPSDTAA
ncbi:ribonuclease H-like domain-containing protein [Tanacetum coccineum]